MNLNVEIRGEGPALLMCNGIGMSIDTWGSFADMLAEHYTLILFDAPGCGGSPAGVWPYSMSELSARVAAQVLARGFSRVHVLGFSFGGMLAQQFAYQFPDLVDRLVLISTLSGFRGLTGPSHLRSFATDPLRYLAPMVSEVAAFTLGKPSLVGLLRQAGAVAGWFGVNGIEAPTLVVGGTDDVITPVSNVKTIKARIPDARACEIAGVGHLWMLHQPEKATSLVLGHLQSNMNVDEKAAA